MTMLEQALALAETGFFIFPVDGDKKSLIKDWPNTATRDEEKIKEWWSLWPDGNIAAAPDRSGHFVIDLDMKKGKNGVAELEALEAQHGSLPDSTYVVTTPSGGFHLWFRGKANSSAGTIAPGIDVRGTGGYVVMPGSKLEGFEAPYSVKTDAPIAEASEWLVQLATKPKTEARNAPADIALDAAANIDRAALWLSQRKPAIEGQGGDAWTFETACTLHNLGLSEERAFELMAGDWNAFCLPPWPEEELRVKVRNAFAYAQNDPGVDAVKPASETFAAALDTLAKEEPAIIPETAPSVVTADSPRIVLRDWKARRNQEPAKLLIDRFLPDGETVLIHAAPGKFKSFIAADIAFSVASGKPAFGKLPILRSGPVIYFLGEGRRAFETQRLRALCETRGVPDDENLPLYTVASVPPVANGEVVGAYFAAIEKELAGRTAAAIVIDPLARSMIGLDENSAGDAGYYVAMAEAMVEKFGCSVVTIAHEGKDESRGARGSSAFLAGFDNVWRVEADQDKLTLKIEPVKLKDDEHQPLHARGQKVAISGTRIGSLVFGLIDPADYRKANGKGGITNADIGAALKRLTEANGGDPVTSIVLAAELWQSNPEGSSAESVKRLLNREMGGRFRVYVKHPGTGRYDPTLWHFPVLGNAASGEAGCD